MPLRTALDEPLIVNAALTGMVPTKDTNPAVPITPEEIAEDAWRCHEAGASIVHVHARDQHGAPTWDPGIYGDIIAAVREVASDLVVCASTSGRNWPEFDRRAAVLDCHPDMASLTLGSLNFPQQASVNTGQMILDLLAAMTERNIRPEFEAFEVGMIDWARDYLIPKSGISAPYYFNLLLGNRGTLAANPRNLVAMVEALPEGSVWAVAGIGRFQLEANALGLVMGGGVRVGLEDNIYLDVGRKKLASNPELIRRVVGIAEALGRPLSSCVDTRGRLGL
ncbi:MAG TPA: 3-keto-5-aminohexanoate cleavage protein [Phycisphaerae bacterium]|nr:3-keto-5-aminohexanoate cleavage protein [Phycisphaerae bacterium]